MKDHYLKRHRQPRDVVFTRSEINEKKHTVADAITAAQVIINGKITKPHRRLEVCLDALSGRSLAEKITMLELNRIQDHLVTETLYRAGMY